MELAVDLHSHSGYAGGVGKIQLSDVTHAMGLKGIDVFGTGDCLLPERTNELRKELDETVEGLFIIPSSSKYFLLQTEVILSTKLISHKNKTVAHHVILFPDFKAISKMQKLMTKWNQKNTIGRPFIVTHSQKEIEEKLFEIQDIDPFIEIIPAHVMTPDGILGSKNNLSCFEEFYGQFPIRVIETGLSADPSMLEKIPDLANLTMISNSDCHSASLNRIGREFTMLNVENVSYKAIIKSIRKNNIVFTAEFNPAEGRYFLTGHRANRAKHKKAIYFEKAVPRELICPICKKKMILGVNHRCKELQSEKIIPKVRNFFHLIPLIEVVAHSLQIKSVQSKQVRHVFYKILDNFTSEINLWKSNEIRARLEGIIPDKTLDQIISVQKGNFTFDPAGFDGNYGNLRIGE